MDDADDDAMMLRNLQIAEDQLKEYKKFFGLGKGAFGCVFGCLPKNAPDKSMDFLAVKQLPLYRDSEDFEDRKKRYKIEMESMLVRITRRQRELLGSARGDHANSRECMMFMKQEKIMHRDLKPTNILLCTKDPPGPIDANSWNYNVKVADFGNATFAEQSNLGQFYGNAEYASPEAIKGILYSQASTSVWDRLASLWRSTVYDCKSDIFMVGVILYQCATGRLPFERPKDLLGLSDQTLELLAKGQSYERPSSISAQLKDLIEKVLETDRKKRLDSDEFLLHPWFTGVEDAPPRDLDEDLAMRVNRSLGTGSLTQSSLMQSSFDVVICGYNGIAMSLISGSFSMPARMAAKLLFRPYVVDVGSGVVKLNIRTHPVWLHSARRRLEEPDWDFNSSARTTLGHAHAVLFVYDTTNRLEFDNTCNSIKSAASFARKNCVFALVGNSIAGAHKWKVTPEEAKAAALAKGIFHRNVSAESGLGIEQLYIQLAYRLLAAQPLHSQLKNIKVP